MAVRKKKALSTSKANADIASALECPTGVGDEARTSRVSPRLHVSKTKDEELSNLDSPSETASRIPAPGNLR